MSGSDVDVVGQREALNRRADEIADVILATGTDEAISVRATILEMALALRELRRRHYDQSMAFTIQLGEGEPVFERQIVFPADEVVG